MPKRKYPGNLGGDRAMEVLRAENEELRNLIVQLKADLEVERGNVRQVRREKVTELKATVDREQHKYQILLGDLKSKLHQEKLNELDLQKETLIKKHENEIQVMLKQRDAELHRLKNDLKKCHTEIELLNQQLEQHSPKKKRRQEQRRGTTQTEKDQVSKELDDVKKSKQQLEDAYGMLLESEKKKTNQLRKISEYHKLEISKVKKESSQEVKKLVEEIGAKDKLVKQLQKELGRHSPNSVKAQKNDSGMESETSSSSKECEPVLVNNEDSERHFLQRISNLNSKLCTLEDRCVEMQHEKTELLKKNKEHERKQKPLQEKNRKFLQRNMELTTINRQLEDKVKKLHDDNQKMKSQVEDIKRRSEKLLHELNQEKIERTTIGELTDKIADLENDKKGLNETVESLKQACSEKDRRIDLLKHRQKRARENRPQHKRLGLKETSFGYEEIEPKSLDSSWSSSVSNGTSITEDTWDEFARDEFEGNYRRLVGEHLNLEKSYALLQGQIASHIDPQRGTKHQGQLLADLLEAQSKIEDLEECIKELRKGTHGNEEKQILIENPELLDKVKELETKEAKAKQELREAQEQHEIMEFRVLELEEIVEKLQGHSRVTRSCQTVTFMEDEEDIQISVLDLLDIDVAKLQQELLTVRYRHDGALSKSEKTVLLQAKAMLDVADKRLKASQSTEAALKERVRELEQEKADLLTEAGINPDLVIEYEDTRNKLLEATVQVEQLENEIKDLKEEDAVHKYTEDAYAVREERFKNEISSLRRQLSATLEGRSAETELVDERAGKFTDYQQKAEESEKTIKELNEKIERLEKEKQEMILDNYAASNEEVAAILAQLRDQLIEKDEAEIELAERSEQLEVDLEVQKEQNSELERINNELTKNYYDIKDILEGTREDVERMKRRIRGERLSEDLEKISLLEKEVEKLKEEKARPHTGDLEQDNQRLRLENLKLENVLKVREGEIEGLEKDLKDVDAENTILRNKFAERSRSDKMDVPRLKVEINAKEYQIQQLKEQLQESEKKVEELQRELEKSKEQPVVEENVMKVEAQSNLQSAPGMTPDQLSDPEKNALEKKIMDLETSEKDLKAQIEGLLKQLKSAEEHEQDLEEKIHTQKIENDEITAEVKELRDLSDELKENEKALKNRLNDLERDLDESEAKMKEEVGALQDKCQSLEMKNMELTELVFRGETEEDKLSSQIRDLEKQLKELQNENEGLVEEVETAKEQGYEKLGRLQDELDRYRTNELKLSESLTEAEQTERGLREQLKRYEGPDSELEKLEALKESLYELEQTNMELQENGEDLETNLQASKELLEENEKKHQEEIKELEEELNGLHHKNEVSNKQIEQLEQNELKLSEQLKLESEKRKNLDHEISELQEQVEGLNSSLKSLEEDCKHKIAEIKAELDTKQDIIKDLEECLEKQGLEGDSNLNKIVELREEVNDKESAIRNLEEKLADSQNTLKKYETEIASLQAKIERNEDRIKDLGELLEKQSGENDANLKKIGELREELNGKDSVLADMEEHLKSVEGHLEKSEAENMEKGQLVEELELSLQATMQEKEISMESVKNVQNSLKVEQEEAGKHQEKINALELCLQKEKEMSTKLSDDINVLSERKLELERLVEKVPVLENELKDANEECANHLAKISGLESNISDLNSQLQESEQFNEDLKDENEALNRRVSDLREQIDDKSEELMRVEEEFSNDKQAEKTKIKEFQEKINVLRNSEDKLLQRIFQLEEAERELRDELDADESLAEETKAKLLAFENELDELKLKMKDKQLRVDELEKETSAQKSEIDNLSGRLKVLDNSECKLMDMLAEAEDKEAELKFKLADSAERLCDAEERLEKMDSNEKDLKETINTLEQTVADLELSEKELKEKLNSRQFHEDKLNEKVRELEKSEQELMEQLAIAQLDTVTAEAMKKDEITPVFEEAVSAEFVDGAQCAPGTMTSPKHSKSRLTCEEKDKLRQSLGRKATDYLVNTIIELTDTRQELLSRLSDMEDSSMDRSRTESVERELEDFTHKEQRYKDTITRLQQEIEYLATHGAKSAKAIRDSKEPVDYRDRLDKLHARLDSFITKSEAAQHHSQVSLKMTDISELPEDELISKIQQHELNEITNRRKICELEDCIKIYRQVVETVALAMATDLEGLDLDLEKKDLMSILGKKDTGYEQKLQQLINSESSYKKQIIEMERRETGLKADLLKADTELNDCRRENDRHIHELQEKIAELEQTEAKLRSKLQLGAKDRTADTLSKIHDLKDHIIDLEASEKQLRRNVEDLQIERDDLRQKLAENRSRPPSTHGPVERLRELEHQQEIDELQAKIQQMENAESLLQDQIAKLRSQDNSGLVERIEHLERSERSLIRKLEMYESRDLEAESENLMDKPEDLLRQRINEFEKMEKHLRTQITDLENDRDELHEIARKDKSAIHELNVKVRELQLAEKNLKEQVSMFEVTENNLLAKIDAMQDELDDQEDQLSRVKRAEKNWKGQAKELKFTEESAAKKVVNLEALVEELQSSETKLKKNLYTSEQENLSLRDKVEALQDQLYDLQSSEIALKQRIRDLENRERTLHCDLAKVECSETVASRRSGDLESLNDSLSERVYALEEERANLKYEVSDLSVAHDDLKKQVALLENNEVALKQQIDYHEANEKRLQRRVQEIELQKIDLVRKADDAVHLEMKQKDKVQSLERNEKKLKYRLQELEASTSSLERGANTIKRLEKENSQLQDELYESHRKIGRMEKTIKSLEDKQRQANLVRAQGGTAVITRQELCELRAKATQLESKEKDLIKPEKSEENLKETISQLRNGKDVCGHEKEIEELHKQIAHYKDLLREKAAMEQKYNHVKAELHLLQDSVKDGDVLVAVKKRPSPESPEAENQAAEDQSHDSPELFPEQPESQPSTCSNGSAAKPTKRPDGKRRSKMQDDGDDSDCSSLDEHPVAGMNMRRPSNIFDFDNRQKSPRPENVASAENSSIGGPAMNYPSERHSPLEADHWKTVEGRRPREAFPDQTAPYWEQVEQKSSKSRPTEDLSVTMNLSDDEGNKSDDGQDVHHSRRLPPPDKFSDPYTTERANNQLPSERHYQNRPQHHRKGSYDTDSGISTMPEPYAYRHKSQPMHDSAVQNSMSPGRLMPGNQGLNHEHYHEYADVDQHHPNSDCQHPPSDVKLSPWLSQQLAEQKITKTPSGNILHSAPPPAWPEGPQRHAATDTHDIDRKSADTIAQLKNKIDDLETELRIKSRELETSQFIQKDLQDKMKNTEDPYAMESRLRDKERDIQVQDRMNQSLFSEEATADGEAVKALKSEVDRIHHLLEEKEQNTLDLEAKLRNLNQQYDHKDKDLNNKIDKVEELSRELRRCQEALKDAEVTKLRSVGDLRNAEIDLARLKDADKKLQKLKEEHQLLKSLNANLQQETQNLERAKKERDELECVVDDLRKRVVEHDTLKTEKADLEKKARLLDESLGKKYDEMEKIKDRAERAVAPLRAKVVRLSQKCKEKDELIKKLADDLKQTGQGSKDLLHEIDHMKADTVNQEYNRPLTPIGGMSVFDDEGMFGDTAPSSSKKSTFSPRSSDVPIPDQVYHNDLYSENADIIPSRLTHLEHTPHLSAFTDVYGSQSRIPMPVDPSVLNNQRAPYGQKNLSRPIPQRKSDIIPQTNTFVAIADYDPAHFSRSGHPRLELPLKEGDVVKVFGPANDKGYCEGEVNGRSGLVPSNYLQPSVNTEKQTPKKRKQKKMPPSHLDASPEHILDMHDHLEHAYIPTHDVPVSQTPRRHNDGQPNGLPARGNVAANPMYIPVPTHGLTEILPTTIIRDVSQPNTLDRRPTRDVPDNDIKALPNQQGPPEPPSDFHIERILSDHNVMVEWQPPPMDELERSNGIQVSGYKIFVDGVECQKASSPHLTKALIGRLNLHVPHKISIVSYTALGDTSRQVDTYFQDVLPERRDGMSDAGSNMADDASVASSNYYESGERKKFMAIYDYNPVEQSPNANPSSELSFQTGDVVYTYGPVRHDGFYHAKIKGKKGLVPASFIEEMPQSSRKSKKGQTKKSGSISSRGSDSHYSPRDRKPSRHTEAEPARLY